LVGAEKVSQSKGLKAISNTKVVSRKVQYKITWQKCLDFLNVLQQKSATCALHLVYIFVAGPPHPKKGQKGRHHFYSKNKKREAFRSSDATKECTPDSLLILAVQK
jgi:hypothetical protein